MQVGASYFYFLVNWVVGGFCLVRGWLWPWVLENITVCFLCTGSEVLHPVRRWRRGGCLGESLNPAGFCSSYLGVHWPKHEISLAAGLVLLAVSPEPR